MKEAFLLFMMVTSKYRNRLFLSKIFHFFVCQIQQNRMNKRVFECKIQRKMNMNTLQFYTIVPILICYAFYIIFLRVLFLFQIEKCINKCLLSSCSVLTLLIQVN